VRINCIRCGFKNLGSINLTALLLQVSGDKSIQPHHSNVLLVSGKAAAEES